MMKFFYKQGRRFYIWLSRALYVKIPLNPNPYLRAIYFFFSHEKEKYNLQHITSVKVFDGKIVTLEIETYRPGLLIGIRGDNIKALQKSIEHDIKRPIQIHVKECMLWQSCWGDNNVRKSKRNDQRN